MANKSFYKQKLITDYFKPIKIIFKTKNDEPVTKKIKVVHGYNSEAETWHCIECGIDLGPQNPRQLCGKWRCLDLIL